MLLPLPAAPYDVPVFTRVKVHRDFHVEVGRALYSAPKEYLGCHLDARADSALVKPFCRGQLVKAHPRQQPGRRVTDPADLPAEKTTYAMRDVASLAKAARRHGDAVGVYAERLLDTDLPWTKMRQVYRLLGLVRRYGPGPVDTACQRALDLDVVNVTKIASMLEKATFLAAAAGGVQRVSEPDVGSGEFVDDSGVEVLAPELGEPPSDDGLVLLGRHEASFLKVIAGRSRGRGTRREDACAGRDVR